MESQFYLRPGNILAAQWPLLLLLAWATFHPDQHRAAAEAGVCPRGGSKPWITQPGRAQHRRKAQSFGSAVAISLSWACSTELSKGNFTLSPRWDLAPSHHPSCMETEGHRQGHRQGQLHGLHGAALPTRPSAQSPGTPFLVISDNFEPDWVGWRRDPGWYRSPATQQHSLWSLAPSKAQMGAFT